MKKKLIYLIGVSGFVGVAMYLYMGFFDISADNKHWKATEWVIAVVRDRSIAKGSAEIVVPDNLDDPKLYAKAAGNYAEMCSACHLAPDTKSSETRDGLYPQPPDFTQPVSHDPARSFWVIKHGIKMTGMPAWGISHSDESIWALVSLIRQLPDLDEKKYSQLVAKYGGSHMPSGGHGASQQGGGSHGESVAGTNEHNSSLQEQAGSDGHGEKITNTPDDSSHGHEQPH